MGGHVAVVCGRETWKSHSDAQTLADCRLGIMEFIRPYLVLHHCPDSPNMVEQGERMTMKLGLAIGDCKKVRRGKHHGSKGCSCSHRTKVN